MKRYKLLKDLPFAKAGDIFKGELEYGTTVLFPEDYENYEHKLSSDEFWDFDEWFEEEPKIYFTIDFFRKEITKVSEKEIMGYAIDNAKSLGLLFETKEKTEKHLKYLQAKEVIKQDTNDFKPDWNDHNQRKFYGAWVIECKRPCLCSDDELQHRTIYFKTGEDLLKSFENHPEEWKTYLTYEQ